MSSTSQSYDVVNRVSMYYLTIRRYVSFTNSTVRISSGALLEAFLIELSCGKYRGRISKKTFADVSRSTQNYLGPIENHLRYQGLLFHNFFIWVQCCNFQFLKNRKKDEIIDSNFNSYHLDDTFILFKTRLLDVDFH